MLSKGSSPEGVSHQPGYQINKKVKWGIMIGMFGLREAVDCLNERALRNKSLANSSSLFSKFLRTLMTSACPAH
jgi:hypothetical protein